MMTLNAKQEAFVNYYLQCWNATEAAKRAGYSEKTAYSQGSRLLKDDEIVSYVRARIEANAMTADECLARLAEHARGDIGELLNETTMTLDTQKAQGKTRLIKKWKQTTITTNYNDTEKQTDVFEVELYDAQAALVHLGKHLGLLNKTQTEVTGKGGKPIAVEHTILSELTDEDLDRILNSQPPASERGKSTPDIAT